ncbi:MAG: 1-(5-phosphoribosyl)-5-[(5-phosphoribosylamino)methylideneamino]imidazole-4-carboxamide isomerase [Coriobacteriaceae bacterium]|nr:1-(5-phosphoribosyl)-5-[(5-phosphoribosylamino)methylideneamino]imidazole-4-carboxamide isomerase [Coriobacteriaceae bacterium]
MQILPAIDLLEGKVVRLAKGDYGAVTVYNDDPVAQAVIFREQGARWLHVVDLDGARSGDPVNLSIIESIISETGLKVEVGGGVRTLETIERLVLAGATRVVLGTKLVTDSRFAKQAVVAFGEIIAAGIDARDGEVAISGWCKGAGVPATELVAQLADWGIRHLVYTDIARDGMQTGIDAAAYDRLAQCAGFPVIASGGIASLDDIVELSRLGTDRIEGVIVGRAIYEKAFTVKQAVRSVGTLC